MSKASTSGFTKADSLFNAQNYYAAQIEYERIIFNADSISEINKALLRKSYCYKQLSNYESAIKTLKRINIPDLNDSMHFQVRYEIALNAFLEKSFNLAENELNILQQNIQDTLLKQNALFLQVLVYNELLNWDMAYKCSKKLICTSNFSQLEKDSLYDLLSAFYNNQPVIKDPIKARKLSSYLPGLGQIYSGEYIEGVLNFTLNASALGCTTLAFYYNYFITGYLGGFSLFIKFYNGGLNRTEHLAKRYNHNHHRKYNDALKEIIIDIEQQKK